ncbi:MAG: hypothetical protein GWO02_21670 [Gammaproteobacteria bacterium]|nr:hypothetical protein [Gammaproteobacteria bacterium]
MTIEEHGAGRQLLRFRVRPKLTPAGSFWIGLPAALLLGATLDGAESAGAILALATLLAAGRIAFECATATAATVAAAEFVQRSCNNSK